MLNLVTIKKASEEFKFALCLEDLLKTIYWGEELIKKSFTHDLIARYLWLEAYKGLVKEQANYYALNVEKRRIDTELGDRGVDMDAIDAAVESLCASEIKDFQAVIKECYKLADALKTPARVEVKPEALDPKKLKKGVSVLVCGKESATVYKSWSSKYPGSCWVQMSKGCQRVACALSDLSLVKN